MGGATDRISVLGQDLAWGPDSDDARFTPCPGGRATVARTGRGLELNGALVGGDAIRFRAGAEETETAELGKQGIRLGELEVRGDVVVRLYRGSLHPINVIALEDYLAAVLGGEMPPAFPPEALKAQAVASRTYALEKKIAAFGEPFHLGASVLHQVYGGIGREAERTVEAVRATRGEVLTYEMSPIEAYFHASCGGRTESGLAALGRSLPYLQSVECPCVRGGKSEWELTLEAGEFSSLFKAAGVPSVAVQKRTRTGRAKEVVIGPGRVVDAAQFRRQVGYTRLKSLWFDVEPGAGREVKFRGRGYGHGAGLCQWGAKAMAEGGASYREILEHYYPGTEFQVLY